MEFRVPMSLCDIPKWYTQSQGPILWPPGRGRIPNRPLLNQLDTGMLDSLLLQKGPMDPVAAEVTQIQRKLRGPRQVAPLMWL